MWAGKGSEKHVTLCSVKEKGTTKHAVGGQEGRIGITLLVRNLDFTLGNAVKTNLRPLYVLEVVLLSIVEFIYVTRCNM